MDYKLLLGIIAVALAFIGYAPYYYNLIKNKTKPHVFSWFIWGVLTGTGYFAQISRGGGFGSWVLLTTSILAFGVAVLTFYKYKMDYIRGVDWFCLVGALLGIILWIITNNPLIAIIIVSLTDATGFIPTFRKAYYKPNEETAALFALGSIRFLISIAALQSFNWTTVIYPASLVLTNGIFVIFLIIRRINIKSE